MSAVDGDEYRRLTAAPPIIESSMENQSNLGTYGDEATSSSDWTRCRCAESLIFFSSCKYVDRMFLILLATSGTPSPSTDIASAIRRYARNLSVRLLYASCSLSQSTRWSRYSSTNCKVIFSLSRTLMTDDMSIPGSCDGGGGKRTAKKSKKKYKIKNRTQNTPNRHPRALRPYWRQCRRGRASARRAPVLCVCTSPTRLGRWFRDRAQCICVFVCVARCCRCRPSRGKKNNNEYTTVDYLHTHAVNIIHHNVINIEMIRGRFFFWVG